MSIELHHLEEGPREAPAVLLAPSLGTTLRLWDRLAEALAGEFRVVRFDLRGHGDSPVPPGPYSVEDHADDVVALADRLGLERFALVGISLGGGIGQVLALNNPDRVGSLVLCCTGPKFADPHTWLERGALVRADGMQPLAGPTRNRWFTPRFQHEQPDEVDRVIGMLTSTSPQGYAACCDGLSAYDVTDRLRDIGVPTRVIAGSDDPTTGPDVAKDLAAAITGADVVVIDGVSHIANVAAPDELNAAVLDHLRRTLPT
jgi:3-oxoadipate enol-lactonase